MPTPDNDLIAELNDLRYLARTETRLGVEPLTRTSECLKTNQLVKLARDESVPGANEHLSKCVFCRRSLVALRRAMSPERHAADEEPETMDRTAAWVMSNEPVARSRPEPSPPASKARPELQSTHDTRIPSATPILSRLPTEVRVRPPEACMANNTPTASLGSVPSLREAMDGARRIFWCNTNRGGGPGSNCLEQRMHARGFAVVWTWGHGTPQEGRVYYTDHMKRVQCGNVIVMYANGLGVIGIGRVTEGGLEILDQNQPDRMRDYATEGENAEEWRIPVEWLVWDEANPCVVEPLRPSFQEITHHAERIRAVRQHFLV